MRLPALHPRVGEWYCVTPGRQVIGDLGNIAERLRREMSAFGLRGDRGSNASTARQQPATRCAGIDPPAVLDEAVAPWRRCLPRTSVPGGDRIALRVGHGRNPGGERTPPGVLLHGRSDLLVRDHYRT